MYNLITLAIVEGTFFSVSVLFDLSPKNKNKKNKKQNNNNKVKSKLTLRVSKNIEYKIGAYSLMRGFFFLNRKEVIFC